MAERDEVAEKAQAIQEIQRQMAEYGLTMDDLVDRPGPNRNDPSELP